MSFFGQNPNAWFGSSPVFATYPPQSDKSATECFTSLWLAHLTTNGGNHLHNLKNRWPWAEPDDDPEFIAFMALSLIHI